MADDQGHPRSGRVRIIGAAPASRPPGAPAPDEPVDEEEPLADDEAVADLPHWTEAPTGQVPAVLSRGREGDDESPWGSLPEPTWREEHTDWAAHEDAFDPSLLAADPGPDDDEERQPWAFELDTTVVPAVSAADLDEMAPGSEQAEATERAGHARRQRGAGWEAPEARRTWDEPEDVPEDEPASWAAAEERAAWDTPEEAPAWETPEERAAWDTPEDQLAASAPGAEAATGAPGPERAAGPAEDLDATLAPPAGRRRLGGIREPSILDLPPREMEDRTSRTGARRRLTGAGASTPPPAVPPPAVPPPGRAAPAPPGAQHERGGRNIPVAIASGLAVGAVAVLCFYFGTISSMVVATAAVGLAALEGYAAFRKAGYHPATFLGLAAVIGVMVGAYNKGEAAEPLVVVLLVAFTLIWHLVRVDRSVADPVRSTLATVFVYGWVGVFGSYAALLLSPANFPHRHGIAYLFGAVATVVAYDVAALAIGSWVGHRPLSSVSPNKTWEGLIGGSVVAMVVAVMLVHLIHPWTIGKAAALGVIVVVLAPIGDLAESLVKRHVGLKDMGRLLPGHGGLLDRIDGLLFVLPATYYLVRAFHLG